MSEWVPLAQAKLDLHKRYEVTTSVGDVFVLAGWGVNENVIAVREYNPIPYKVECVVGEGWELLKKGDIIRNGDEWFDKVEGKWKPRVVIGGEVDKGRPHRRRIQLPDHGPGVGYQWLKVGETLEIDDWYLDDTGSWQNVVHADREVEMNHKYARPIPMKIIYRIIRFSGPEKEVNKQLSQRSIKEGEYHVDGVKMEIKDRVDDPNERDFFEGLIRREELS